MPNNLSDLIKNLNNKQKYPALNLVKDDPTIPAVISKLVKSKTFDAKVNVRDSKSFDSISKTDFSSISRDIQSKISDVENIKDLFPDVELAQQIIISSVLSPKDMMSTNLIYKLQENIMSPELTARILEDVRTYCDKEYDINEMLPDILLETLFETGAYIKAILPESSVDELINTRTSNMISTESLIDSKLFNKNMNVANTGYLGTPYEETKKRYSFEAYKYKGNYDPYIKIKDDSGISELPEQYSKLVEIVDNVDILKLPKIIEKNIKNVVQRNISTESLFDIEQDPSKVTTSDIEDMMYKDTDGGMEPFRYVPNRSQTRRKSIGKPLLLKLPIESTIPVHVPGDPSDHIGYFVLIDDDGNPLSAKDNETYLDNLNDNLVTGNNSLSSFLIQKAKKNLMGNDRYRTDSVKQQAEIYTSIVEADLVERLRKGIYNRKLGISNVPEVYRIMLARSLANKQTKLLFMPKELVSYFANDYADNGTGKSLMDNLKIITSLRAILLFAKVMAMTKSAIAVTHVNISLDEDDPDPQKTIEVATHEVIKMRQQYFPLGINSPVDVVDWIQRAGIEFSFEGHPGLPETKFDFDTQDIQHHVPDGEFDEMLRKWTFLAMGIPPEMVDKGFDTEFATTAVINNLLLSKRVLQIQKKFTKQLSDFLRKVLLNDSYIQNMVLESFKENKGDLIKYAQEDEKELFKTDLKQFFIRYYNLFVDNLAVELPKPDASKLDVQANEFELYQKSLETALDSWINTDVITSDIAGNISNYTDAIKATLKAYYERDWMAKNNYLPELADITATDEDGKPKLDLYKIVKDHDTALIAATIGFVQKMNPIKKASDEDLERMENEDDDSTSSSSYDSGSSDSSSDSSDSGSEDNDEDKDNEDSGDEGSDDSGGGDDFNFDF